MLRSVVCVLVACLAVAAGFAPVVPAARQVAPQRAASVRMATAASKATRVNRRNREHNKQYKSEMRTRIKRVRA